MSTPTVERSDRSGHRRPGPRLDRWAPVALARRRALAIATSEAEASWHRNDPPSVVKAWRRVVEALAEVAP